eukprot:scaffold2801_cov161-Ochromonas_danica.AAC.10
MDDHYSHVNHQHMEVVSSESSDKISLAEPNVSSLNRKLREARTKAKHYGKEANDCYLCPTLELLQGIILILPTVLKAICRWSV